MAKILYPSFENKEDSRELLLQKDNCDKYDYLIAAGCGVIGGLIDIFLVGAPRNSIIGNWTDQQIDTIIKNFARLQGWKPHGNNSDNVNSAIGFFQRKYRVNYDQKIPADVGGLFDVTPKTHHMMSLAHSPDPVGLFFSIVNQFTSTSSFFADGKLITINTETYELYGNNTLMKIMCGFSNWLGHLISDVAGSSGAQTRGVGIVAPFYELFGLCKFGEDSFGKDLSELAMRAFTEGMDFRFSLAQAVPIVITELSIRLIWAIRQRFQYKKEMKECIPTLKHDDLRIMLIVGDGTLCVLDGIAAGIKSGGNTLTFFLNLNLVAWFRLIILIIKEILNRVAIEISKQKEVVAFKRVNEEVLAYYKELEKIDVRRFKEETKKYNDSVKELMRADTPDELNEQLYRVYENLCIEIPWKGDFNEFMGKKENRLVFS